MILSFNGKECKQPDGADLAMLSRPGKSTVAEYLAFSKHSNPAQCALASPPKPPDPMQSPMFHQGPVELWFQRRSPVLPSREPFYCRDLGGTGASRVP